MAVLVVSYITVSASDDPNVSGYLYPRGKVEGIEAIQIKNSFGTFSFAKGEDGWTLEHKDNRYRAYSKKMDLMTAALAEMAVERVFDEALPQYGLTPPMAEVMFTMNGKPHHFVVGEEAADRTSSYVRNEDSGVVALVGAEKVAQLTGSLAAYRDKNVFTVDLPLLAQLGYYKNSELELALERAGQDEWNIVFPFEAPARNLEMADFLSMLNKWTVAGFPDMEQVSVAEMGLEKPEESLLLVDVSGNMQVLEFGNISGTGRFVRNGEEDDIVVLYTADVDLSHLRPEGLMNVAPLRATLDKVRSISVADADGNEYLFDVNDAAQTASVNGRLVDYNDFIHVFYKYIMTQATGRDDAGARTLEPVAMMETVFIDGTRKNLVILPRDNDTYFILADGEAVFYLPKAHIDELFARIYKLTGK